MKNVEILWYKRQKENRNVKIKKLSKVLVVYMRKTIDITEGDAFPSATNFSWHFSIAMILYKKLTRNHAQLSRGGLHSCYAIIVWNNKDN